MQNNNNNNNNNNNKNNIGELSLLEFLNLHQIVKSIFD